MRLDGAPSVPSASRGITMLFSGPMPSTKSLSSANPAGERYCAYVVGSLNGPPAAPARNTFGVRRCSRWCRSRRLAASNDCTNAGALRRSRPNRRSRATSGSSSGRPSSRK